MSKNKFGSLTRKGSMIINPYDPEETQSRDLGFQRIGFNLARKESILSSDSNKSKIMIKKKRTVRIIGSKLST